MLRAIIRRFRRADLARILEIEAACFPADAYPREMFLDLYRECGKLFFVAERRRRAVGYMVSCASRRAAEVVSIGVDPAWRTKGLGSLLMGHTFEVLRKERIGEVWLMVRTTNAAALRFYRHFGFRRVRIAHRYYQDGADAVRMRLRLKKTRRDCAARRSQPRR